LILLDLVYVPLFASNTVFLSVSLPLVPVGFSPSKLLLCCDFLFAITAEKAAVGRARRGAKGAGQNEWASNREGRREEEEEEEEEGLKTRRRPYEHGGEACTLFKYLSVGSARTRRSSCAGRGLK
jgi:hypothetical protein